MSAVAEESVIIQAWNTVLFDKFCRFRHLIVDGLANHSNAALARRSYARGERVLDIGCGFGDSTIRIAQSVAPDGEAVGMDCAGRFIEICNSDARAAGVANAHFFTGD